MNHYEILGIHETASRDQVRAAYLRHVQVTHPDRHVGEANFLEWHDCFKRIHDAYEVLYDDVRRDEYDRLRSLPGTCHSQTVVIPVRPRRHDMPSQWIARMRSRRPRSSLRTLLCFLPAFVLVAVLSVAVLQPWRMTSIIALGNGDRSSDVVELSARIVESAPREREPSLSQASPTPELPEPELPPTPTELEMPPPSKSRRSAERYESSQTGIWNFDVNGPDGLQPHDLPFEVKTSQRPFMDPHVEPAPFESDPWTVPHHNRQASFHLPSEEEFRIRGVAVEQPMSPVDAHAFDASDLMAPRTGGLHDLWDDETPTYHDEDSFRKLGSGEPNGLPSHITSFFSPVPERKYSRPAPFSVDELSFRMSPFQPVGRSSPLRASAQPRSQRIEAITQSPKTTGFVTPRAIHWTPTLSRPQTGWSSTFDPQEK